MIEVGLYLFLVILLLNLMYFLVKFTYSFHIVLVIFIKLTILYIGLHRSFPQIKTFSNDRHCGLRLSCTCWSGAVFFCRQCFGEISGCESSRRALWRVAGAEKRLPLLLCKVRSYVSNHIYFVYTLHASIWNVTHIYKDNCVYINIEIKINEHMCFFYRDNGLKAIENLMEKKGKFDYILLETTGLADPGNSQSITYWRSPFLYHLHLYGLHWV